MSGQPLTTAQQKDLADRTLYFNSRFEYIGQRATRDYNQFKQKDWNAVAWRDAYFYAKENLSGIQQATKLKNLRVLVMMKTLDIIEKGWYINESEIKINVSEPDINIFYREPPYFTLNGSDLDRFNCRVEIDQLDCLVAAGIQAGIQRETFPNKRIAVLNMASKVLAGGGYKSGEAAQEENIFRRTNYCTRLDSKYNYKERTEKPNQMVGYPLAEYGGAYTRDVTVFRGLEDGGYLLLETPFTCDFVAVHAPKLERPQDITVEICKQIFYKIVSLFKICIHNGCRVLVLGALGCGAYNNPPEVVASIFNHALGLWGHFFEKVITCIL
jgi:uncharacterized protein (TIGR02452 family)